MQTGYASASHCDASGKTLGVYLKRANSLPKPKTNGFRSMLNNLSYDQAKAHWLGVHDAVKNPHSYFYANGKTTDAPKPYPTLLAYAEAHIRYLDTQRAVTLHTQAMMNRLKDFAGKEKLRDLVPALPVGVSLAVTRVGVGHLTVDTNVRWVGDARKRQLKAGDALCKPHLAQVLSYEDPASYLCYHCLGVAQQFPLKHGLAI